MWDICIALYIMTTKDQIALQGLVGDFFMAQVAAVTILTWKQPVGFSRCPQYRKSNRPRHQELHALIFNVHPSAVRRDLWFNGLIQED